MSILLVLLVTVVLLSRHVINAADSPAVQHLLTSYEDALDQSLLDSIQSECDRIQQWAVDQGQLMHGKRPTLWLEMAGKKANKIDITSKSHARFYIEKAILILKKYIMKHPELLPADANVDDIVGAEYWVQIVSGSEGINFHYDKDESVASNKGIMLYPLVSSILYLTDIGAPTLIFNQTSIDGNFESPEIPDNGYLSYPKENRYTIFRGNLQHGVLASAAKGSSSGVRKTLLINWWAKAPEPPNTFEMTDKNARTLGILNKPKDDLSINEIVAELASLKSSRNSDGDKARKGKRKQVEVDSINGDVSAYDAGAIEVIGNEVRPTTLVIDNHEGNKRHQLEIPPGDMHFVYLPQELIEGVYYIQWGASESYGAVGMLDLFKSNQVSQLFNYKKPKLLILYHHEDKMTYKKLLHFILPFAKKYIDEVKVYFCPYDKCSDALRAFGLSPEDLPRLAIDHTSINAKFVQPKEDYAPTKDSLMKFWNTTYTTFSNYKPYEPTIA